MKASLRTLQDWLVFKTVWVSQKPVELVRSIINIMQRKWYLKSMAATAHTLSHLLLLIIIWKNMQNLRKF